MSLHALFDVPAPAKLNLFLHVIGRRADGHHLLQSVFVLIDWIDTLHFECRSDGRLARHDLTTALPPDDLCLRAARSLQAASGTALGVDISIDKQVPWGAGLGGGSSDAATTLLALNRLWGLQWPRSRLLDLALTLGADLPFFIGGTHAWVEGIGEKLTPFPVEDQWFALFKPPVSIETRSIFQHPDLVRDTAPVILEGFDAAALSAIGSAQGTDLWGRNDLQPVAESLNPEVKLASKILQDRFGNSRMSGSGSAVFARMADPTGSEQWMSKQIPSEWTGRICRLLPHHPLRDWVAG